MPENEHRRLFFGGSGVRRVIHNVVVVVVIAVVVIAVVFILFYFLMGYHWVETGKTNYVRILRNMFCFRLGCVLL